MRPLPATMGSSTLLLGGLLLGGSLAAALSSAEVRPTPAERSAATGDETTGDRGVRGAVPEESSLAIAPVGAGLVLYFDPERGTIVERPTPAQRAALRRAIGADRALRAGSLHESSRGLRTFAVPEGVGVALEGRFTHALVLRPLPDGGVELHCIDDPIAGQEARQRPAARAIEKQ